MRKNIFLFFLLSVFTFSTFAQEEEAAPAEEAAAPEAASDDGGNAGGGDGGGSESSGDNDQYNIVDFSKIHELGDYDLMQNDTAGKKLAGYNLPDFTNLPAHLYSAEDIAQMNTNLKLHNWMVDMSKSSISNHVLNNSAVRAVTSNAKGTVLGVRTFFPNFKVNSVAFVRPPFIIPSSFGVKEDGTNQDETQGVGTGYGILHNVGVLRSVSLETYGRLFPYKLSAVFERASGEEIEIVLGDLNFEGWRTLVWNNPNYIEDVRYRKRNPLPLYPQAAPWLRFKGVKFYKNAEDRGGDFVAYIGKINVIFDKAFVSSEEPDIKDEDFWFIDKRNSLVEKYKEISRLAEDKYRDTQVEYGVQDGSENEDNSINNNNPDNRNGDNGNPDGMPDDDVGNMPAGDGVQG